MRIRGVFTARTLRRASDIRFLVERPVRRVAGVSRSSARRRIPEPAARRENRVACMSDGFETSGHLPDDLLERIRSRATAVDAENVFPDDDLAELREAGYLKILVPTELGGAGLGLAEATVLQQKLAGACPPRRSRSTCTWCGRRWRRCCATAASTISKSAPHRRSLRRGVRIRDQRGGQRSRAVLRQRHGRTPPPRRLVRLHGDEDLHLARARVGPARPARPRHDGSG